LGNFSRGGRDGKRRAKTKKETAGAYSGGRREPTVSPPGFKLVGGYANREEGNL